MALALDNYLYSNPAADAYYWAIAYDCGKIDICSTVTKCKLN